ncbi:MAG: hypothetical protein JW715_09590 [Sedimentisphaerales bacterium]|nr:hypothetical protein [Sedimentisphaerales bacterium]
MVKLREGMKMVKKSLITIALLAFLATTVQAGDLAENPWKFDDDWPWTYTALEICQIPVYMEIGMYVELIDCGKKKVTLKQVNCDDVGKSGKFPCYYGCTTFEMRANFEVKLGLVKYKIGDVIKDWSAELSTDIIPGDGNKHSVELCVTAWSAQIWNASPGSSELVGEIAITVKPNA